MKYYFSGLTLKCYDYTVTPCVYLAQLLFLTLCWNIVIRHPRNTLATKQSHRFVQGSEPFIPEGSVKCSRHSDAPADCLIPGKGLSLQLAEDEVFSATLHSYSLALAKFSNLKQLHLFKTSLVPWGDWFSCLGVSDVEGSLSSLYPLTVYLS